MEQESRYRWIITVVCALFLALVTGQILNGLAVYLVPLEVAQGWDRAEVAAINTAGLLGLASGGFLLGRFADRIQTRLLALIGVGIFGAVTSLASMAVELWQLYLAFFVAGFVSGGMIYAPLMALVSNWFTRGAGLAIGVVAAGQALGQGGVPFTGALLIDALGWRGALLTQSLLTVAILVPLGLLLRPAPILAAAKGAAAPKVQGDGPPQWQVTTLIGFAGLMCCVCMSIPLVHLVPLIQGCGFTAPEAGGLLLFMLAVALLGRLFFGWLADRLGALPTWMLASAWQTVLIFGFTLVDTLEGFYIYAAIYGFGYGGVMTGLLATVRELTPPTARAKALGVVMAFTFTGHGLGGFQGGLFYSLSGAYGWSYASGAFAGLLNLATLLTLFLMVSKGRSEPRTATA